jgi:hypothetical protein
LVELPLECFSVAAHGKHCRAQLRHRRYGNRRMAC